MKKPKRKPRFGVGQVVFHQTYKFVTINGVRWPHADELLKRTFYYSARPFSSNYGYEPQSNLRPLTAKEKGPRRGRGQ